MVKTSVLIIEDNTIDFKIIDTMLSENNDKKFILKHALSYRQAKELLNQKKYDIILLDLSLPDSHGFDTFSQIYECTIDTPIIILTSTAEEELAQKVVREGAQDYLRKGKISTETIIKSINYSINRYKLVNEIVKQSLLDELTGLYNRRGFLFLSNQKLQVANREKQKTGVFFIDVNGLKWINDNLGHETGDQAIKETAGVINELFRESDIKARLGGDEFVIFIHKSNECLSDNIQKRLSGILETYNSKSHRPYMLSLSIGYAEYNPQNPISIDELINQADLSMYNMKQQHYGGF